MKNISKRTILIFIALAILISSISSCAKKSEEKSVYELTCPECGQVIQITEEQTKLDEIICPNCGAKISLVDQVFSIATSETNSTSSTVSTQSNSVSKQSTVSEKPNQGNANLENNVYKTGYPIVKDKIVLKVFTHTGAGSGNFDDMKFTKDYENKTNIKIQWQVVPSSQLMAQTALLMQSNNLPDIASPGTAMMENLIAQYGDKEKAFYNIAPLIDKWAPYIAKIMKNDPAAKKVVTRQDGSIYALPEVAPQSYSTSWIIRKSWLEAIGKPIPKTTAEFKEVLRLFKTSDPNHNGDINDEIPLAVAYEPALFRSWGLNASWFSRFTVDKNGKARYSYATQNFSYAVKFWRELYSEGLVDPATFKNLDVPSALKTGKVGCARYNYPSDAINEAVIADYIPMPELKGEFMGDFNGPYSDLYPGYSGSGFFFFKSSKNITAALRWADFFYSGEGYMYKNYGGAAGKYYQSIGTKFHVLESVIKNDSSFTKQGPRWSLSGITYLQPQYAMPRNEADITNLDRINTKFQDAARIVRDSQRPPVKNIIAWLPMNLKEGQIKGRYEVDGNGIWDSFRWAEAVIKGQALPAGGVNVADDWNSYIAELRRLGLSEYEGAYQSAYARYSR
jgi:ABC-type glycerol-3-phosphate transport system substrate-binding protein